MNSLAAADQGLEQWNSTLQSICGQFETQMAFNRSLFIGEISVDNPAGVPLAHLRTNAGLISRKSIKADHDNDQDCFLVSQRSGFCHVAHNGTQVDLAPGDLLLMDSVGACEIAPLGLIEHTSLSLSRRNVERVLGGKMFGKVSASSSSGKMLHMLVDQLSRESDSADSDDEGDALCQAMISLLPPALAWQHKEVSSVDVLQGATLRSQVQKIINESLTQPNLSPVGLAARLNISVRHLYRLFEEQGDSVCRYIQRSRLKRSADDLSNPFLKRESITSIAYKWGFTDSAHFSRAFKKHFEQSPKDFRASALLETTSAA